MTPSIPVAEPDCVWPDEKPAHMVKTIRMLGSFPNGIFEFTRATPQQSIMTKLEYRSTKEFRMAQDERSFGLGASFVIRHLEFVINGAGS
jgi:hypothetical protein